MDNAGAQRLQKVLANQGLASRREIERWIEQGRIMLNGQLARLGERYRTGDRLLLDGKPLHLKSTGSWKTQGLMYYKPDSEVTTRHDEKGRRTVFDSLPDCPDGRWVNVGRLDINTSGLLLFTNNGELANRLMHPRYRILREYAVRVLGTVSDEITGRLLEGVAFEDGRAHFETIADAGGRGSNHWYHVTIRQGRNREVRRLWESQHIRVSRLIRVRFGPLKLDPGMKAGQHRLLCQGEINQLLNEVGFPVIKADTTRKNKRRSSAFPAGKRKATGSRLRKGGKAAKRRTMHKSVRNQ